jgi:hypothetical protein
VIPVEGRLILLNALPLNIFPESWREYAIQVRKIDVYTLKDRVLKARKIKSYIRHQSTVEVLQRVLGIPLPVSAEAYKYAFNSSRLLPKPDQPNKATVDEIVEWFIEEKKKKGEGSGQNRDT